VSLRYEGKKTRKRNSGCCSLDVKCQESGFYCSGEKSGRSPGDFGSGMKGASHEKGCEGKKGKRGEETTSIRTNGTRDGDLDDWEEGREVHSRLSLLFGT